MNKAKQLLLGIGLAFALLQGTSQAAVIVSWELREPNIVARSGEIIDVYATVHNDAASTQDLFGWALPGRGMGFGDLGFIGTLYDWDWAPFQPPSNLRLRPGESADFLFGSFLPVAPIAPGNYVTDHQYLLYIEGGYIYHYMYVDQPLTVTIVADVPEPSALPLLAVSGIALTLGLRKRG